MFEGIKHIPCQCAIQRKRHFAELQKSPFLSVQQEELKNKFQKYCIGRISIWESLLDTFCQNKKALLIYETLQQNGRWMGHIKTLRYYLFDIHALRPIGNDLSAQLDKIQNAIQNKDMNGVVHLMQNLSPKQQLFLMPVFNMATDLLDFKELL